VRGYFADYEVPGASQIDISEPAAQGPGCGGRAARDPLCAQERLFLQSLEDANVVVVREGEMRLYLDQRVLLRFVPEAVYLARQAAAAEDDAED
jgi:hypothetical protein